MSPVPALPLILSYKLSVGSLSTPTWSSMHSSWSLTQRATPCPHFRITESQNYRMVRVGRDLCESSSPTLLPKQAHLQQALEDLVQAVLNISRERDSTASLGSLFHCPVTLRGKRFFLMFRRNFLCLSLCPLPLVLSLGTTEKSLAPSS